MSDRTIPSVSGHVANLSDLHINDHMRAGDGIVTAHGFETVLDDNLDVAIMAGDLTDVPALPWGS